MITAALTLLSIAAPPWFGPATVTFKAPIKGNPYDPAENNAWVICKMVGGKTIKRLAFADDGVWKARLVQARPGPCKVTLIVNGKSIESAVVQVERPIPDGYVRSGGQWGFRYDSGKTYWPLGHNLGWQPASGFPDLTNFLGEMGQQGINWSRIWACSWDGKNPWWPNEHHTIPIGTLWPPALKRWDALVEAAQNSAVRFQFVLFHHGEWSTTTDPNWKDNPWNTANGGFLANPVDFFTNAKAKQLSKMWIRYAVARWGASQSIMAWEIFNEVQWVDAVKQGHEKEVGIWHDEMARYLRSLDVDHHLVVTSSDTSLPIWREMDAIEPHGYPARVAAMVLASKPIDKRPFFYGEVGPGSLNGGKSVQLQAVRDGIWSGLLALHAGAAQYWTWDLIPKNNLHREYKLAHTIMDSSQVLAERQLAHADLDLGVGAGFNMIVAPGRGWEPTSQFVFNLPKDAVAGMGNLSTFLQGSGHREMQPNPIELKFVAPKPGTAKFSIVGISSRGGGLEIQLNGKPLIKKDWTGSTRFSRPEVIEVDFAAGPVNIKLQNNGLDWVQLGKVEIPGIANEASASTISNSRFLMARIEKVDPSATTTLTLGHVGVLDGLYAGRITNLDTGLTDPVKIRIKQGRAQSPISATGLDSILWLRKVNK